CRADYLARVVDAISVANGATERAKIGHDAILPAERMQRPIDRLGTTGHHPGGVDGVGEALVAAERAEVRDGVGARRAAVFQEFEVWPACCGPKRPSPVFELTLDRCAVRCVVS